MGRLGIVCLWRWARMIEKIFIKQGLKRVELDAYMKKQLQRAGFTKLEIVKTPLVTRIVVNVTSPGLAIGKGGQNIRTLTKEIEEKFGVDNPQLEIKEIAVPELDAQAMADRIASLIERGFSWKSIGYRSVRDIMGKGAQGVELILSGKLGGKGARKRRQRIAEGYMKKVGDQVKLVDFGMKAAVTKAGTIGIKVRLIKPETVFPDKFRIEDIGAKAAAEASAKAASEKEEAKETERERGEETAFGDGEKEKEEAEEIGGKEDAEKAAGQREGEKKEAEGIGKEVKAAGKDAGKVKGIVGQKGGAGTAGSDGEKKRGKKASAKKEHREQGKKETAKAEGEKKEK